MKKLLSVCLLSLVMLVLGACSSSEENDFYKVNTIAGADVLKQSEDAYIAYFYQPSCVHCQEFKPTMKEYIAQEDSLKVYPVNIELATEKSTWNRYEIQGTPTTMIIQTINGKKEITQVLPGIQELKDIPTKTSLGLDSEPTKVEDTEEGSPVETETESVEEDTTLEEESAETNSEDKGSNE